MIGIPSTYVVNAPSIADGQVGLIETYCDRPGGREINTADYHPKPIGIRAPDAARVVDRVIHAVHVARIRHRNRWQRALSKFDMRLDNVSG